MDVQEVRAFFDRCAPEWDQHLLHEDDKLSVILDAADIHPGVRVLDVACGTGVLFQDYLARGVARVTGVDLSPEMLRVAAQKHFGGQVELICGDVETLPLAQKYDRIVVYNAFPHFAHPAALVAHLTGLLAPCGRLTVAHSMSLAALHRHHAGVACRVSREMLPPHELAALMRPALEVDVAIADDEKYIVSGFLR